VETTTRLEHSVGDTPRKFGHIIYGAIAQAPPTHAVLLNRAARVSE